MDDLEVGLEVPRGPTTRSKAKKARDAVHTLVAPLHIPDVSHKEVNPKDRVVEFLGSVAHLLEFMRASSACTCLQLCQGIVQARMCVHICVHLHPSLPTH